MWRHWEVFCSRKSNQFENRRELISQRTVWGAINTIIHLPSAFPALGNDLRTILSLVVYRLPLLYLYAVSVTDLLQWPCFQTGQNWDVSNEMRWQCGKFQASSNYSIDYSSGISGPSLVYIGIYYTAWLRNSTENWNDDWWGQKAFGPTVAWRWGSCHQPSPTNDCSGGKLPVSQSHQTKVKTKGTKHYCSIQFSALVQLQTLMYYRLWFSQW